ncbi:hypothetical protein SEA_KEELAN_11 [Gordonia phage Keelan]|nr:hypothetical protein SEA_KEELAN_11 [Gordonia phage Keelan]
MVTREAEHRIQRATKPFRKNLKMTDAPSHLMALWLGVIPGVLVGMVIGAILDAAVFHPPQDQVSLPSMAICLGVMVIWGLVTWIVIVSKGWFI